MNNGDAAPTSPRTGQKGDLATMRSDMAQLKEENQLLLSTVRSLQSFLGL